MAVSSRARIHDVADFVAIVAGVTSIAFAVWGTPIATGEVAGGDVRNISVIWLSYGLAGLLAVAGVAIAQERRKQGRLLLAAGGAALLIGLLGFARAEGAIWASIVPGVLMLATAPFIGPMPTD